MRQIFLDTETTGMEPAEGHRIIEIGCVEMINRRLTGRTFHKYLNPEREVDAEAVEVHGLDNDFLADKPRFADIVDQFRDFVAGAELIIHNAPFDVGFINHEFALIGPELGRIEDICTILDTLALARKMFPGQRNSLDALCKRFGVDNSSRTLHGALLDSEILADVYLMMTGGQTTLSLGSSGSGDDSVMPVTRVEPGRYSLRVIRASEEELAQHEAMLDRIDKKSGGSIWRKLAAESGSA